MVQVGVYLIILSILEQIAPCGSENDLKHMQWSKPTYAQLNKYDKCEIWRITAPPIPSESFSFPPDASLLTLKAVKIILPLTDTS